MKRLVGVILCISVLMIACNKKNQQALTETNTQKDFPKTMYVNATDGLRVRNSPSSDGERIGLLNNLTEVTITKEDNNTVNIGGTDGKWVYITEPIEGWIFDGFLDNYDQYIKRTVTRPDNPEEKFTGAQDIIDEIIETECYYTWLWDKVPSPSEGVIIPFALYCQNNNFETFNEGSGTSRIRAYQFINNVLKFITKLDLYSEDYDRGTRDLILTKYYIIEIRKEGQDIVLECNEININNFNFNNWKKVDFVREVSINDIRNYKYK
jgi:hypothetical protein